jgi:hypothetical protein
MDPTISSSHAPLCCLFVGDHHRAMTTTDEPAEEQKAREEAQARRRRILDGAGTRMDVVEGVIPQSPAADGSTTTSSSASKMAAMRRRRFKKKTDGGSEETAPATENAVADEVIATTEVAPEPKVQEETVSAAATASSLSTKKTDETVAAAAEEETTTQEGAGDTKKKYMGVAKMRRLKLKEKHQQEHDQQDEAEPSALLTKNPAKKRKSTARLPILMHIVTVLLLFLAGLDIGLQQVAIDYQQHDGAWSVLDVHTDFAPRTLGGVSFLMSQLYGNVTFVRGGDMKVRLLEETIEKAAQKAVPVHRVETDEFAAVDDDQQDTMSVIDPIFGVDLDDLTAGPGTVPWGARQAVKFHRVLLRIFYYGPIRIFNWLLACATSPPIFCLVAILLRQLVGKAILGAALPDSKEGDDQRKDVFTMAKTFVTNFLFSAFPPPSPCTMPGRICAPTCTWFSVAFFADWPCRIRRPLPAAPSLPAFSTERHRRTNFKYN